MTFPSTPPPLGACVRGTIIRWIDADTVEVQLSFLGFKNKLRLREVWAPELRSKNEEQKRHALEGKEFVNERWPPGTKIIVHMPTENADGIEDVLSFARVLSWFWERGSEQDSVPTINEQIVNAGYAKIKK